MLQLLLMIIYQMNHILFEFIIQTGRSPKTNWCQIGHLRHVWYLLSLFSLDIWYTIGRIGWFLSETNFLQIWCVSNSLGIWTFDHFRDRCSLAGQNFLYVWSRLLRHERFIIILWSYPRLMTWGFAGIFPNIWIEQIILQLILYGVPICDLRCTISVPFGVIVPSIMNGTVEN